MNKTCGEGVMAEAIVAVHDDSRIEIAGVAANEIGADVFKDRTLRARGKKKYKRGQRYRERRQCLSER